MPTKQVHEVELVNGMEVKFKHVDRISETGGRFDVWPANRDDDRRWRVDILDEEVQVVASYLDGGLANVETPGWLEEWAGRVRMSAAN